MTDRELLELAAKAGGIRIDKSETNGGGVGNDGFCVTGDAMLDWHNNIRWNPLTNDGDALRLAVTIASKRRGALFSITISGMQDGRGFSSAGFHSPSGDGSTELGEDLAAATRRAIVRAAAEIGKAMQQEHRRTTP